MISLVINADTRKGSDSEVNATGDHGSGSLQGVRSYDFLVEGVRNKRNFFAGHDTEVILFIDEHEPLPDEMQSYLSVMLSSGEIQKLVCQPHGRTGKYWNDRIYLEALKLATGDYVAHFDQDCAAFRSEGSIIDSYLHWLSDACNYKFVCQPSTMHPAEHKMWWASTRFFICKRDTLDFDELERTMNEAYRIKKYGHCPALEHVLGRMAGENGVLYPAADWSDYVVFSWQTYHRGLLAKLNAMPYDQVRDYVLSCGLHGPNDLVSRPL